MALDVTVGIDIGTTSVKALAVDADGGVVARARVPHRLVVPAPDLMEHDAVRAWRRGPRAALAGVIASAEQSVSTRIRQVGVCVSSMVPSVTAVDNKGIPRTPGLLYGDARGGDLGAAQPGSSEEVSEFIRWTSSEFPGARGYWPALAVANYALGRRAAIDTATAFTYFPLHTGMEWDAELLSRLGAVPAQMPAVVPLGEPVAKMGDGVLSSGSIDALGEQMVAGARDDGDVLVICGSTLVVWVVVPEWVEVPGLWTVPHTVPGKVLIGGASNAGGLFLQWVAAMIGFGSLEAALERFDDVVGSSPARDVPVWAPYPRGERTPLHDPARRAAITGMDMTHGPSAVLRAALEATGFVVRHHVDLAIAGLGKRSGVAPRRIVATGGGSRSRAWMQALADATGLVVDVVAVPEGAALGSAYVARMAAGLESSFEGGARWARIGGRIDPLQASLEPCSERYLSFRELSGDVG